MPASKKKTIDRIKDALAEMLGKMPFEEITATSLCEYAKVNRATFYYHYDSIRDVLAEIEKQVENEFLQFLSQPPVTSDGSPEKSFYVTFFDFVARNVGVCRMLLGTQHQSEFLLRAMEAGRTKVDSVMGALYPDCPHEKIDYYYIFVSNGFLGLLEYWLNSGMRESINEIAEVGEKISFMGIKYLQ